MLSFLRLSVWLRATGLLLEQSQTLKVWCHSFRSLRLIWPNAERAFSAETPDGCSRRQSRPSDRDHRVPITGRSESCLLGARIPRDAQASTTSQRCFSFDPGRGRSRRSLIETVSGRQGFLSVLLQPRQAKGHEDGNDPQSHFIPMGFLAVAGCMLLATAMSAALTSKPSNA